MTDKQKDYILKLDETLLGFSIFSPKIFSVDILGLHWKNHYKDISLKEASNCINKLNDEIRRIGCYSLGAFDFDTSYEGDAIF